MKIILASTSPYRAENLRKLTPDFLADSPLCDESILKKEKKLAPLLLSRELSRAKAVSLAKKYPSSLIIGSDQVLSFNRGILSKPETHEKAIDQLTALQGQEHELFTGLCVLKTNQQGEVEAMLNDVVIARMEMYQLTRQEIESYLLTDKPYYCAGSYMIEANGIKLFKKIDCSDFSSIIGLPILQTHAFLRALRK
jgi:septum formation protein